MFSANCCSICLQAVYRDQTYIILKECAQVKQVNTKFQKFVLRDACGFDKLNFCFWSMCNLKEGFTSVVL